MGWIHGSQRVPGFSILRRGLAADARLCAATRRRCLIALRQSSCPSVRSGVRLPVAGML